MKPKQTARVVIDLLMTALLLALMAYMLTGQELHEWLGEAELVLFLAHLVLNARWLQNIGKGKYGPYRVLQTALALLVFAAMLGSMVSGIMMSRYVFDFLPIRGGMALARSAHMLCGYWGFLLISAHLGIHWGMVLGMARKAAGLTAPSGWRTSVLRLLALGAAGYGVYGFAKHRIADYLFLRVQFVFFDFEQSPVQFFAEYLAMLCLWAVIAYYAARALQKLSRLTNRIQSEIEPKEETT